MGVAKDPPGVACVFPLARGVVTLRAFFRKSFGSKGLRRAGGAARPKSFDSNDLRRFQKLSSLGLDVDDKRSIIRA